MPFAGYKNFKDCVTKVCKNKGLTVERAKRYCGAIKAKAEKKKE